MGKLFLFILAITLITSCKEKTNLEAEVMAIHDEVMPKMGDIHLAKKELRKLLIDIDHDSLKTVVTTLISNLEVADEGMMEWMHQWKVPANEEEKNAYFLAEKEKITKVKEDMLTSLENANNYLAKSTQK